MADHAVPARKLDERLLATLETRQTAWRAARQSSALWREAVIVWRMGGAACRAASMTDRGRRHQRDDPEEAAIANTTTSPTLAERFSAAVYEPFLWLGERAGMAERRRRLLAGASGRVLEIGAGTGLNLGHYPETVDELMLAEPVAGMAQRLEGRVREWGRDATVVRATAEELPFADGSFDTVVSTLVLCTVEDPERAVSEVRRVLRSGGRLLFVEHVRSDSPRLARWQDRLEAPWRAFADGCRCNRDTLSLLESHLTVRSLARDAWRRMPRIVRPLLVGEAGV